MGVVAATGAFAAVVTSAVTNRHATKVRTHTRLNEPFTSFIKRAVFVRRRISRSKVFVVGFAVDQFGQINCAGIGNFCLSPATDKHWLALKQNSELCARINCANVNANRGKRQDIC